jgi:hypothetical protein
VTLLLGEREPLLGREETLLPIEREPLLGREETLLPIERELLLGRALLPIEKEALLGRVFIGKNPILGRSTVFVVLLIMVLIFDSLPDVSSPSNHSLPPPNFKPALSISTSSLFII